MNVNIHSVALRREIVHALSPECTEPVEDGPGNFDGLVLLKYCHSLEKHLRHLYCTQQPHLTDVDINCLLAEMTLLMDGHLKDPEVFGSFGYEALYEKGYLTFDCWKAFQNSKVNRDLDLLEDAYDAIDEDPSICVGHPSILPSIPSQLPILYDSQNDLGDSSKSIVTASNDDLRWVRQNSIASPPRSRDLILAASRGQEDIVKCLLDQGVDPDAKDRPFYLDNPLVAAIKGGYRDIVQLLIGRGADVRRGGQLWIYSPLWAAFKNRRSSTIDLLLTHSTGPDLLWDMPPHKRWIVAKTLLDYGVDANELLQREIYGEKPDVRLLSILLDAGAEVARVRDELFVQTQDKPTNCFKIFCSKLTEAKILSGLNRKMADAIRKSDHNMVKFMLKEGAEPSCALPIALKTRNLQLACLLLDSGADARFLNPKEQLFGIAEGGASSVLLSEAIEIGHMQLLQLLLDQGADVNCPNEVTGEIPLTKAIRAGSVRAVGILLENGAAVDGVSGGKSEVPLVEAMKARNSSMVGVLLRNGAHYYDIADDGSVGSCLQTQFHLGKDILEFGSRDTSWTFIDLGLMIQTQKIIGLQEKERERRFLRKLLCQALGDESRSPESALISACMEGDLQKVLHILQRATLFDAGHSTLLSAVLDLDAVECDTTALIAAIRSGHPGIVKVLILHGADINTILPCGTPLSVAAEVDSEQIVRILLKQRADLHVAVHMLRSNVPPAHAQDAINKLNQTATRYREDLVVESFEVRQELRYVRCEFIKQHAAMMRAARRYTYGRTISFDQSCRCVEAFDPASQIAISKRWAFELDQRSRKAWRTGIRAMRGLCNGIPPQNLNETIMFLGIAKAMSTVMDAQDDHDSLSEFNTDLSRWQILFEAENGGLRAFREAVRDIWGVNFEDCPRQLGPDADSLEHFRYMALNLVSRASTVFFFKDVDQGGLLSTQLRWRRRIQEYPLVSTDGGIAAAAAGVIEESTYTDMSADPISLDPVIRTSEEGPGDDTLHNSKQSSNASAPYEHIIVLLMAGAIFAFVIAFLLGMF
jgi:ankyrin repeat protein